MAIELVDDDLADVLGSAQSADLDVLVDILTDNGKGRLFLSNEHLETLRAAKEGNDYAQEVLALIAHLIQRFGGNTLANLYRKGKGVAYRVVLEDVADHLGVRLPKETPVAELEQAAISAIFQKAWDKMSAEERANALTMLGQTARAGTGALTAAAVQALLKLGGFSDYRLAMSVANAMSMQVLGRALPFAFPGLGALLGPLGLSVTAVWALADLSAPAYRVTVPSVVQIAYMRKKRSVLVCPECSTENSREARFCSNCGHKF